MYVLCASTTAHLHATELLDEICPVAAENINLPSLQVSNIFSAGTLMLDLVPTALATESMLRCQVLSTTEAASMPYVQQK